MMKTNIACRRMLAFFENSRVRNDNMKGGDVVQVWPEEHHRHLYL
jgi:hypothetical protein